MTSYTKHWTRLLQKLRNTLGSGSGTGRSRYSFDFCKASRWVNPAAPPTPAQLDSAKDKLAEQRRVWAAYWERGPGPDKPTVEQFLEGTVPRRTRRQDDLAEVTGTEIFEWTPGQQTTWLGSRWSPNQILMAFAPPLSAACFGGQWARLFAADCVIGCKHGLVRSSSVPSRAAASTTSTTTSSGLWSRPLREGHKADVRKCFDSVAALHLGLPASLAHLLKAFYVKQERYLGLDREFDAEPRVRRGLLQGCPFRTL